MDNPEGVVNTTRIKGGDLVRVHLENANDYYLANMAVAAYIGPFTLEGISLGEFKPGIYREYGNSEESLKSMMPGFLMEEEDLDDLNELKTLKRAVMHDYAGITNEKPGAWKLCSWISS